MVRQAAVGLRIVTDHDLSIIIVGNRLRRQVGVPLSQRHVLLLVGGAFLGGFGKTISNPINIPLHAIISCKRHLFHSSVD